jgi:hypothetical protein
MSYPYEPIDLTQLRVLPLSQRRSLTRIEDVLVEPANDPPACDDAAWRAVARCARDIQAARQRGAAVMLIYGAHLIKNGAQLLLNQLMDRSLVTHLATNGAGTIHDWEYAWHGASTESVRENVATGTFGAWDETGRYLQLALLAGALRAEGYGQSLGRFIQEDGVDLPAAETLARLLREEPQHPLAPARAEMLRAARQFNLHPGRLLLTHTWRNASVLGTAFRQGVPFTVHPGIGYDIISNHPMFNGAVIGRAAQIDFRLFAAAVERLEGGVVLSIGSAIMGPQVFEKTLSCVNNLRLQAGRSVLARHQIYVVDLQDGGRWDWTAGEPPKDNPAYYLRFCKSYSRMGGTLHYVQCDNVVFLHNLLRTLERTHAPAGSAGGPSLVP